MAFYFLLFQLHVIHVIQEQITFQTDKHSRRLESGNDIHSFIPSQHHSKTMVKWNRNTNSGILR